MHSLVLALTAVLSATASSVALAQETAAKPGSAKPAAAGKSDGKTVEEVTVTGAAADVQTSIDRRSYTLGKDLQATTGSIGDALRNVPSVEVDLEGNLSLRGDPNVTILIDGKPSGMFEGAGRADALQQLPADQIERVEVITNPSAALNPEGSGGVINLITKTSRGAGRTGSIYITAGSGGLKRAGGNFGYNSKKLTVSANLGGGYQHNKSAVRDERGGVDPRSGLFLNNVVDSVNRNLVRGPIGRISLGYALDPKTQLTAAAQYSELVVYGHPYNRYEDQGPNRPPQDLLIRQGAQRFLLTDVGLSTGLRRSFAGDGHDLSVDLIRNTRSPRNHLTWTTLQSVPLTAMPIEAIRDSAGQRHSELKVAYSRPLPNGGKLKTGYELKYDDNDYRYSVARGVSISSLSPDPSAANDLGFKQTTNAIYGTYERGFSDITAQAGLRLEEVRTDINQLTSGQTISTAYSRAYPTLHLGYKLDDERQLTASYSKRVQRPPPVLLNPLRYQIDPKNIQQGNPDLAPQETQSFEAGYEQRRGQTTYLATAYYRRNEGEFSYVLRDLGNGVFLSTFDNLGSSRSAGLELVANGRFTAKLTYNASTNLYWSEVDAGNLGVAGARSAYGLGGRANLNWQVRPDDLVQINAFAQGKRLLAQGYTEPVYLLNLGWRHKVNDRVTATTTVQDVFGINRFERRFDTPALRERFEVSPVSRSITVRLDYRFGGRNGRPQREPGFEYEAAAPPP